MMSIESAVDASHSRSSSSPLTPKGLRSLSGRLRLSSPAPADQPKSTTLSSFYHGIQAKDPKYVQCNGHLLLTDTTLRITEHERGWMKFSPKHFEKRPVLEWSLAKLTDVKVTDRYSHGALDATHEHPLLLLTGECLDRSDNETAESKVALVGLDNPYAWSKAINYARKHVEYTQPYEPKSEYAQGYWGS
mmetsp:Transcript_32509/g.68408  ORF Transcript_32509/g.68408 Transcript_32509/m.68408 type:complete len:190 (-) Transcript_32509:1160-1729(-)